MKEDAILAIYSNVISVERIDGGALVAKDSSGNDVAYDEATVSAKATELSNAWNLSELRNERNKKLSETDYWMLSDTNMASQAQIDYRQALRDITNTYSSLDTVVWPTKP